MTDKIKEIRDRVEQDVAKGPANKEIYRVHKDRAFLLAEVERLTRERDEARANNERMREVLRDALNGLQYWCPQSSAGAVERSRIMARGEKALEAKP